MTAENEDDTRFRCVNCGAPISLRIDTSVNPNYEWWCAMGGTTRWTCQAIEEIGGHVPETKEVLQ